MDTQVQDRWQMQYSHLRSSKRLAPNFTPAVCCALCIQHFISTCFQLQAACPRLRSTYTTQHKRAARSLTSTQPTATTRAHHEEAREPRGCQLIWQCVSSSQQPTGVWCGTSRCWCGALPVQQPEQPGLSHNDGVLEKPRFIYWWLF
jgi:hypothetical protein